MAVRKILEECNDVLHFVVYLGHVELGFPESPSEYGSKRNGTKEELAWDVGDEGEVAAVTFRSELGADGCRQTGTGEPCGPPPPNPPGSMSTCSPAGSSQTLGCRVTDVLVV